MKKSILLIMVIFSFQVSILSQACLPEGIIFSTQNQIDNFQINYPGCTEVGGNVMIGDTNGSSDITNLNGLSILTTIDGRLSIGVRNTYMPLPYLTSLSGLENLTSIGGSLVITSIPLTNMSGLEGLTSIGDSLYIAWNSLLTSLTGLNSLITVGGGVFIGHFGTPWWDNPVLASLTGLENLTTIGDKLYIGNTALTSLTGLDNLTSIGGDFFLGAPYGPWNFLLTSLTGLENLTSIGGSISIFDNDALTSLTGLNNIDPGSITGLSIGNNPSLSICDVQSICSYLSIHPGTEFFQGNAPGCNNRVEVEADCNVGIADNIGFEDPLCIYPNPASNLFTISFTLNQSAQVNFEVTNQVGQVVATILDELMFEGKQQVTWNAEGLSSGIYFYRLKAGNRSSAGKLFVMQP